MPFEMPDVPFCDSVREPESAARRWEDELLARVQALRQQGGEPCGGAPASAAPELRVDARLGCAARVRARDAFAVGAVNAVDSAGRTVEQRLAEVAYVPVVWGESYALDVANAPEALAAMRTDVDSCQRLSDPSFVDIGVGVVSGVAIILIGAE
jgi:uncharacterized protein YkwD